MLQKMPYLLAITFIGIYPVADTYVLIPAMSEIAQAMPGVGRAGLNFIITISSLVVIPASVLAGRLVSAGYLTNKGCVLLGSAIFTLGGLAGGLIADIRWLLFTRAVLGLGNGLVTAMVVGVTIDYFTERETPSVMGIFCAASNILAIGLTVLSGYLVLWSWRYAFAVYLADILIIFYHQRVLQKNPTRPVAEAEAPAAAAAAPAEEVSGEGGAIRAVWGLLALALISKSLGNTMFLALSYFIEGEGLGNAADTGLANGVLTAAIGAVSFAFGWIYGQLGRKTATLFFFLMAAGNFLLARSHSFSGVVAALALWGLGSGLTVPYLLQETIARSPRRLAAPAGALVNSSIYVAFVVSTFIQPAVARLVGTDDLRVFFTVVGAALAASGLLMTAFTFIKRTART
ncbi:MAG: MFS transporter [Candidatus Adiutrix sp.]|jgi:MFS family permease|nr:MFS transporter [Candidatus Adiutrix sp.]